jgi:hypothetical protein
MTDKNVDFDRPTFNCCGPWYVGSLFPFTSPTAVYGTGKVEWSPLQVVSPWKQQLQFCDIRFQLTIKDNFWYI